MTGHSNNANHNAVDAIMPPRRRQHWRYLIALLLCQASNCPAHDHTSKPEITQGAAILHSDILLTGLGLDGEGVTVAVISDSFNCLGGAATGQTQGELPTEIRVLQEADCQNETTIDEGRAMLEVIHDIAPKPKLLFHAMVNNRLEQAEAKEWLVNVSRNNQFFSWRQRVKF
jgi:hypothetical protein